MKDQASARGRIYLATLIILAALVPATTVLGQQKPNADKKGVACADATFVTLRLKGLHCAACAGEVKQQLMKVAGVESAEVSAEKQRAVVAICPKMAPKNDALKTAVKKAGYSVVAIEKGKPKEKAGSTSSTKTSQKAEGSRG